MKKKGRVTSHVIAQELFLISITILHHFSSPLAAIFIQDTKSRNPFSKILTFNYGKPSKKASKVGTSKNDTQYCIYVVKENESESLFCSPLGLITALCWDACNRAGLVIKVQVRH